MIKLAGGHGWGAQAKPTAFSGATRLPAKTGIGKGPREARNQRPNLSCQKGKAEPFKLGSGLKPATVAVENLITH